MVKKTNTVAKNEPHSKQYITSSLIFMAIMFFNASLYLVSFHFDLRGIVLAILFTISGTCFALVIFKEYQKALRLIKPDLAKKN